MTHTPTPWYIEHDPYPHIRSEDHGCILARDCLKQSDEEFIVKACNAHDDLVAALIIARGYVEATWSSLKGAVGENNIVKPDLDTIDAVLEKAAQ